jgi:PKD repeat protein
MIKHRKTKSNLLFKLSSHQGILFHIAGITAIIWFIFRVLPRPDRIRYPCQQMSISIAFGYIAFWSLLWSAIFHVLAIWVRRVKYKTAAFAPVILVSFILIFSISSGVYATLYIDEKDEKPTLWDPIPKEPIGTPQGYKPGRVVWCWDANATEEYLDGYWWENQNNNQEIIDQMFSLGIKKLADIDDDYNAWDLLFKHFNQEHGHGEIGYQSGERIAIKINLNNCGSYTAEDNDRDASPQIIKALLRQLVNTVNVDQDDIYIYDASRTFGNWLYNRIYYEEYPADPLVPEFPDVHYVDAYGTASGREKVVASVERVYFAAGSCEYRTLPTCVAGADYLINIPLLKRHPINTGVTLAGKNFFGTWMESVSAVHNYHYLSFTMGNPTPQTDLFAHENIGGKIVLNIGDGLFATPGDHRVIGKFSMYPFENDWTNSLFFSQDQVAIDSVMYDFLLAEGTNPCEGSQNYLHQSAEPNPYTYDPENDGEYLSDSLGVHEHWDTNENIFSNERYSGPTNDGIDYLFVSGDEIIVDAAGPYFGLINEPVQFNGYATGGYSPYSWEWDFGDGSFSYEQNPVYTYTTPGNYTVTLNVTDLTSKTSTDYTWCWIQETNNPPDEPGIQGPTNGKPGETYDYNFVTIDPDGTDISYFIDWGDETNTGWLGPYESGEIITKSHFWSEKGTYIIKAKAKDPYDAEGPWGELTITIPKNKEKSHWFFFSLLERFPLLQNLISQVLEKLI